MAQARASLHKQSQKEHVPLATNLPQSSVKRSANLHIPTLSPVWEQPDQTPQWVNRTTLSPFYETSIQETRETLSNIGQTLTNIDTSIEEAHDTFNSMEQSKKEHYTTYHVQGLENSFNPHNLMQHDVAQGKITAVDPKLSHSIANPPLPSVEILEAFDPITQPDYSRHSIGTPLSSTRIQHTTPAIAHTNPGPNILHTPIQNGSRFNLQSSPLEDNIVSAHNEIRGNQVNIVQEQHTNPNMGNHINYTYALPQQQMTNAKNTVSPNSQHNIPMQMAHTIAPPIPQVASTDDRSILTELVNRTDQCQSDHFQHVFLFFMAIAPLFQLQLVADSILMKYLLPKVRGNVSRLFLVTAARGGSFDELCNLIRNEIFSDRTIFQLADTFFLRNFQTISQPVNEYFQFMHNAYIFLQLSFSELEAVNIIMENLWPDTLAALSGHMWPKSFNELFALTKILNRRSVILQQRVQIPPPTISSPTGYPTATQHQQYVPQMYPYVSNPTIPLSSNLPVRNQRAVRQCYNCGDPNHLKPQCPRLGQAQQRVLYNQSYQPPNQIRCFKCNQMGHRQAQCRQTFQSGNA